MVKNLGNLLMGTVKAYGCTKLMQNTGMNLAEVFLYKDAVKTCSRYYSRQTGYMLKSIFAK